MQSKERKLRRYDDLAVLDYIEQYKAAHNNRSPSQRRIYAALYVVLVYKLDRPARNSRLQLQIAEELDKLRIRLVSVTEPMAFTGSSGRFSLSMLAEAAQFFSDRTSEDVSATLATKAAGGAGLVPCRSAI